MKKVKPFYRTSVTCAALAASIFVASTANAADHQEAPAAAAMLAADIGDYYAWHDEDQLNLILTFGTFAAPGQPATYNSDVLYGFHFDTSTPEDATADVNIYARFAQDTDGNWGLQISGIGDEALEGSVETVLSNSQLSGWAGLVDDPFFFDQEGFNTTVGTGILSFDPNRDAVAGLNITAIAIQVPVETIMSGGGALQTWTTTSTL
ncbi:MAG: DUF4331 family protein [Granulosicoccus sp.]